MKIDIDGALKQALNDDPMIRDKDGENDNENQNLVEEVPPENFKV